MDQKAGRIMRIVGLLIGLAAAIYAAVMQSTNWLALTGFGIAVVLYILGWVLPKKDKSSKPNKK